MSYGAISAHRPMVFDAVRNAVYGRALRQVVGSESTVLDLGAGTGILGLMAARLGAKRVYLVEPEDVIAVAEEIAAANGLDDRVVCIQGRIEDVPPPESVDVVVSVLTGNFLLTEDLLQALFHARDHWLKPDGVLIPSAATMEAAPVSAGELHDAEVASWSRPQEGIDLGLVRAYAANTVFYRSRPLRGVPMLAEPQILHSMDFHRDTYGVVRAEATYEIATSGICHGWVGWSNMKVGDSWLLTSPYAPPVHWSQAFLPLDPPMTFDRGERVSFALSRAPHGDWTWIVRAGDRRQQHSTLLSLPVTDATLRRATREHPPTIGPDGRVLAAVLGLCDGSRTIEAIAEALCTQFPDRYRSPGDAVRVVEGIVRRHV